MNPSLSFQDQLLVTKLYVPMTAGPLISRPRLTNLLDKSLKQAFTLVSAAAGFGKTTLLSSWARSLPAGDPMVAWISLDEEDNDPRLFWAYVLAALSSHRPDQFAPLLESLHVSQALSPKYVLTALINLLAESPDRFVLILDDYQVITEPQVHKTLTYLVEHLPPQLRLILATRADPPLPLPLLRVRERALEVRDDQLRCTVEETRAFFHHVIGLQLPEEILREVTTRTEGWLVGLHLLRLSLPERADPLSLLQEVSGNQRDILDYLTQDVLRRQPPEIQTFLLSTCILEQLTASLCDAVLEQTGSQQILQRIEQANLFIVSLDSKRQWYRYHALFAEALQYRLDQTHADLVPTLHLRASFWYAEHSQTTQAILHALHAKAWDLVADLIEQMRSQLSGLAWGISLHQLTVLHQWLKQLPPEIVGSRPLLCYACTEMLWGVASYPMQQAWLNAAEATLRASLTTQMLEEASSETLVEQQNLLGSVIGFRAVLQSYQEHAEAALPLCQEALSLISADHVEARIHVTVAQTWAYYASAANDTSAAVESGLQAIAAAQAAGQPTLVIGMMSVTAVQLLGMGRLNEAQQMAQQAIELGKQPGERELPHVSLPAFFQAEVLREWNQLDAALSLIEEAISLGEQVESYASLASLLDGYGVLLRVHLSRGELDAACSAFQKAEDLGRSMEHSLYLLMYCYFTMIDQVRLWLACGQLDHAMDWAEQVEIEVRQSTPLTRERVGVARARIFLAKDQPALALQRLEPALQRATAGKRWGHVIEIRLLQDFVGQ